MSGTQERRVQTIIAEGVSNSRLLQALREVPSAGFVPSEFRDRAYLDEPLPISHGQVSTQPSLTAKMIEALRLTGSERILEVGTGYGFQTALLCRLSGFVWSVERCSDLAASARDNLARHGIENAVVLTADGTEGLPGYAPFEAVIVTAAYPLVPSTLTEQLAEGGRLLQPLGSGPEERVVLFEKEPREGRLVRRRDVSGASFVRLHGAHAFPQSPGG